MVTSDPQMSASWHWTPPSPKPYILTFPHCCFGAVSQNCLKCCLPGCSPILPQIKLNSQLSSYTFFFFFFSQQPAYRFLRRQVKWSGIPISNNFPQFVVIHIIKGFSIVNEAEADVFLEFSPFFYDPVYVDDLIFGSCAFSKSNLNNWKFSIHVPLKPGLENFEHYFANMWNECNCAVVWTFLWHWLSLGLEWKLTFPSPVAMLNFPYLLAYWVQHFSQHHLLGFEIA